ncbi:MAG: C39 family peptidase [Erythrobacter sp.]
MAGRNQPGKARLAAMPGMLACVMVGACSSVPAGEATPIWLGAISPAGPTIAVPLTSWKDKKFENLVRQRTDFSCGAAALATIFNYAFGRTTSEQQVLVNMLRVADPDVVRQKGFSLLDMKTYAQSVGYQAEGYRVDYATLQKLEVPSIALLDIRGYKHFVVIRRAWDERVAIGDPAIGNMIMTRPRFEEAWNGILFVVSGDGYVADNILLNPPEPLSAKRLLELTATIPGAEVAEFGFGPRISF